MEQRSRKQRARTLRPQVPPAYVSGWVVEKRLAMVVEFLAWLGSPGLCAASSAFDLPVTPKSGHRITMLGPPLEGRRRVAATRRVLQRNQLPSGYTPSSECGLAKLSVRARRHCCSTRMAADQRKPGTVSMI